MWFLKGHLQLQNKTAIIAGASQGLGAEIGKQLYQNNCSVILVARRESKLKEQVETITSQSSQSPQPNTNTTDTDTNTTNTNTNTSVSYEVCDLSDYSSCEDLWKRLYDRNIDPDFIFACNGGAIVKKFNDLTPTELEQGIDANYKATLYFIHSGFKQVLKSNETTERKLMKHRHIVLCSSTAALYSFIGYCQYGPTKAAIMNLSMALRQEVTPYNYRVSCVFPGNFDSEGFQEEQRTKPEITQQIEGPSNAISVEKCADIVLDQLDRGFDSVFTDFIGWVLASASLGASPRFLGLFQVLVSLLFLIIAPLANMVVVRDIEKYFKRGDKEREKKEEEKKEK